MRFCLATTFYPPWSFGGDGVFVRRLARALVRRGHEVRVVFRPDVHAALAVGAGSARSVAEPTSDDEGIELWPIRPPGGRAGMLLSHQTGRPVLEAAPLRRALDGELDVVHFHNVSLLGAPGVLRLGGRAVTLCTLHDYWFVCPTHVLWRLGRERCTVRTCLRCTLAARRPPQLWRSGGVVHRGLDAVDAFIAPSRFSARLHQEHGFPARIETIPHFPERLPKVRPAEAAGHRPYFLAVGRLEELKGFGDLIETFHRIPEADLLLVGTGGAEADLRRRACGLDRIRFLGWQEGARLSALYRGAVATVVPSLCYETFGLVPVESFAAGTPVVVRGGGALEEVVAGGGGVVFETRAGLERALRNLLDDPDHRERLAAAGRRNLDSNYTEEIHMERYFRLIAALWSPASSGGSAS